MNSRNFLKSKVGRDPSPGTQAYVAGWGALIPEDVTGPLISILVPEVKRPSVLQVVNVPVITNDKCENWHHSQGIEVCTHSLIRGVLIQSCSAGAKNFTNYVFCHPQFSGAIQNIENCCPIRAKF